MAAYPQIFSPPLLSSPSQLAGYYGGGRGQFQLSQAFDYYKYFLGNACPSYYGYFTAAAQNLP